MTDFGDRQPITYEVRRASPHPIKINDAGRLALSQIVIVEPPPDIKDEVLEAAAMRNKVRFTQLSKSDTEGTFEVRAYTQTVDSMARISTTIRDLRAILNAAIDPEEYARVIYNTPHPYI